MNTDKILQERKYEESMNKMKIEFQMIEEKYQSEIEELSNKLQSAEHNDDKLEKLKVDL